MHIYVPRYPRKRMGWWYEFQHLSPEGDILWEDTIHNELSNAGENSILDVYFRNGTAISTFYGRLYNDTIVDTDTMSTLSGEVAGTGYSPSTQAAWARNATDWPTLELISDDWRVSGAQRTYTAGAGGWSAATQLVLASSSSGTSGTLVAWVALSTTRTLSSGDSLNVTPRISLD